MTEPFSVRPDDLRGYGSRTRARMADFHYQPADSDGDWPSHGATRRFHGQVQATGQGLSDDLDGSATHAEKSADAYSQQEGVNSGALKDGLSMATGAFKDVAGIGTNLLQTGTQALTQVGTAVTQAGTTAMNATITAASTAATAASKAGGQPAGLTAGAVPDSPTTKHDGKGHEHADVDADSHV